MTLRSNAITALGLAGGVWVVLSALSDIAERIKLFRGPIGDSANRLRALPRAAFGAALGHIGFGVMVLGHRRHDTGVAEGCRAQSRSDHGTWRLRLDP